jgi:hypothetical protein
MFGPEDFTLNGVSLDTYAYMLTDISGIMQAAARRGENVAVPGRHGRIHTPKPFDAADIVLPLWIVGAEEDGSIPVGSTEAREFFKRRDELLRVLYANPLLMEYTRPDGHAVSAFGEVLEVLDFTRRHDDPLAQVNVALSLYEGFWQDSLAVSHIITGPTGTTHTLTEFEGATAPMTNLILTFGPGNNPLLIHGDATIQYHGVISAGRQLSIDTETWTVGPGTGTLWSPDPRQIEFSPGPRWFELNPYLSPLNVEFVHTGGGSATVTISGRRRYLSP